MTGIYPGHENYEEVMVAARNEYLVWLNRNSKESFVVEELQEEVVDVGDVTDDYTFLFDTSTEDTE
jgi:hypothetical protein